MVGNFKIMTQQNCEQSKENALMRPHAEHIVDGKWKLEKQNASFYKRRHHREQLKYRFEYLNSVIGFCVIFIFVLPDDTISNGGGGEGGTRTTTTKTSHDLACLQKTSRTMLRHVDDVSIIGKGRERQKEKK